MFCCPYHLSYYCFNFYWHLYYYHSTGITVSYISIPVTVLVIPVTLIFTIVTFITILVTITITSFITNHLRPMDACPLPEVQLGLEGKALVNSLAVSRRLWKKIEQSCRTYSTVLPSSLSRLRPAFKMAPLWPRNNSHAWQGVSVVITRLDIV